MPEDYYGFRPGKTPEELAKEEHERRENVDRFTRQLTEAVAMDEKLKELRRELKAYAQQVSDLEEKVHDLQQERADMLMENRTFRDELAALKAAPRKEFDDALDGSE